MAVLAARAGGPPGRQYHAPEQAEKVCSFMALLDDKPGGFTCPQAILTLL
jgi:hypothetical protein